MEAGILNAPDDVFYLERAETFCRMHEIGYHRVITDTPVEAFVVAQLRGRMLG